VGGFLFWWPLLGRKGELRGSWEMVLYLFLATIPCDILSGFLEFSERIAYPALHSDAVRFGMNALQDQQCAAALMWTCVTIAYLIPGAILSVRSLSTKRSANHRAFNSEAT